MKIMVKCALIKFLYTKELHFPTSVGDVLARKQKVADLATRKHRLRAQYETWKLYPYKIADYKNTHVCSMTVLG